MLISSEQLYRVMSIQEARSSYQVQNTENMLIEISPGRSIDLLHNENESSLRRELILCKSSFWCASSVPGFSYLNICPVCRKENVRTVPVYENYHKNTAKTKEPLLQFEDLL